MCPSVEARLLARLIAPITIKITGQVARKSKYPPRIWSIRNKTPRVTRMAGPMRPRIVQRWQWQRTRSLIEVSFLSRLRSSRAAYSVSKHKHTDTNQNQRPQPPNPPKRKPVEIVQ